MKKMFSIIAALLMLFAATNTFAANTGASPAAPEDYIGYKVDVESGKYNMTLNLKTNTLSIDPSEKNIYLGGPAVSGDYDRAKFIAVPGEDDVYTYKGRLNSGMLKFFSSNGEDAFTADQYVYAGNENVAVSNTGSWDIELKNSHDYQFNMSAGWYDMTIDLNTMKLYVSDFKADGLYIVQDGSDGNIDWKTAKACTYDDVNSRYVYDGDVKKGKLWFATRYNDINSGLVSIVDNGTKLVKTNEAYAIQTIVNGEELRTANAFQVCSARYKMYIDLSHNTVTLDYVLPEYIYMVGSSVVSNTDYSWLDDHTVWGAKIYRQADGTYLFKGALYTGEMKFTMNDHGYGDGDWVATTVTTDKSYQVLATTSLPQSYGIQPWVEGTDTHFYTETGEYEMVINLTAKTLTVNKYEGEIVCLYGASTGSYQIINPHGTMYKEQYTVIVGEDEDKHEETRTRYVWKGHLAKGDLRLTKQIGSDISQDYIYHPIMDISEQEDGTPLDQDVTGTNPEPRNTSRAGLTNIVKSYYKMKKLAGGSFPTNYFKLNGGYYHITVEDIDTDNPIMRFHEVRDVLQMIGEATGGWDFDNWAIPMEPTIEGFVYRKGYTCPLVNNSTAKKNKCEGYNGYLMGLEMKFCEQDPGTAHEGQQFGPFYTHAWGPLAGDDIAVKGPGSFRLNELSETDMSKDYKFDMYPGDYEIIVNLTEGNETMTVREFTPHQKIVVSSAGYATFMTPYYTHVGTTVSNGSDFKIYKAESLGKRLDEGGREINFKQQQNFEASTPYIIKAAPGTYDLVFPDEIADIPLKTNNTAESNFVADEGNMLVGSWHMSVALPARDNKKLYLLQKQNGVLGFYYAVAGKKYSLAPYSCYLDVTKAPELEDETSPAKMMKMVFIDIDENDISTSIGSAINESGIQDIYSIGGVKTNAMHKGINIVRMADGSVRKIMIK